MTVRSNRYPCSSIRHVLVTGAGGGLGAGVCDQLAASGDTVFATDRDPDALRALKGRLGVVPLRMDVTASGDVARARKKIEAMTDGLDGLVCCAGIFQAGALIEADEKEMERALDINVMGAFRTVQAFFPLLTKRSGTVVLVGSELSHCAMPFNGPYTVSKCALQAYADALRRELMFIGMHVVALQPGAIRTALLSSACSTMEGRKDRTLFPAQFDVMRRMLSREWETGMEPADVARVVVRALHSRKPRAIYRVGNDPFRAILGKLPASWTDGLIRVFISLRSSDRRART
ncbi:MAG: SDR family NAD(P)-dependent oxidoreductase [Spirochaetes bacterium]|nr:SDR family NAD(P)-dependent oxidoreductase [Spirochaetota bacterium]